MMMDMMDTRRKYLYIWSVSFIGYFFPTNKWLWSFGLCNQNYILYISGTLQLLVREPVIVFHTVLILILMMIALYARARKGGIKREEMKGEYGGI